jgi:DeoR/GlpR family transcriptional regulator of sugar metabolism
MLAGKIKEYLTKNKSASLAELSRNFNVDSTNIRTLLEVWESQGKLRRSPAINACCSNSRGCNNCTLTHFEVYDWIDLV